MDEEWKPVVGFEDLYEVSSFGHYRATKGRTIQAPKGTVVSLVREFGTTINSVENILYMRMWKHVTEPLVGQLSD